VISYLKRRYIREQYMPGWLGLFINPYYHARQGLYQAILGLAPEIYGRVIDIGCGYKPYQELFTTQDYVGLEYDSPDNRANKKADFFYDGKKFPFSNNEFDCAICSQVLEHVFTPLAFLSEINRVLKPGALFLITIPFVWDEHEQPQDFARYSSFGIKAILEQQGFEIVKHEKTVADLRVIFQLVNAYLCKAMLGTNPFLNIIICAIVMSPFNIMGWLIKFITPGNSDLYLDNVVLAKKRVI